MRVVTRIGGPRRTAGWTLLELVVTIFILVLALLLSGPLLETGLRFIAFEQERILEAEATNALKQLRADVTSASEASGKDGELILSLPGGRTITYGLQEDRLRRRFDEPPKKGGERTVLDGVGLFQWASLPGSAVRIELSYLRIHRLGRLADDGQRVIAPQKMRQESLVLALRGGGGGVGRVGW